MTRLLLSEVELMLELPMVAAVKVGLQLDQRRLERLPVIVESVQLVPLVLSTVQEAITVIIIGQPKALILFELQQGPEPQQFEVCLSFIQGRFVKPIIDLKQLNFAGAMVLAEQSLSKSCFHLQGIDLLPKYQPKAQHQPRFEHQYQFHL